MKSVYLLQHLHTQYDGEDDWKLIGIYTSRSEALNAIKRVTLQPGFSNFPEMIDHSSEGKGNGFNIDEYVLNVDNWESGFVTNIHTK